MTHVSPLFEDEFTTVEQHRLTEGISAPSKVAGSELAPTLLPRTTEPLFNPALLQEINRTGIAPTEKDEAVTTDAQRGFAQSKVGALAPLSAGLAAGGAIDFQTTDPLEAGIGVGLGTLAGAGAGALAGAQIGALGGPIGAAAGAAIGGLSALVIGGTKAWFGVKNARKRNRALKELQRKAELQRVEDIARNEKWKRVNQFNTMQEAAENRKQTELQNKWRTYQNVALTMTNLANSDAKLNEILRNQLRGVA